MKFKVSEFAKMTGVSVRTLHYYDEIGLLKPVETDKNTGYRFYDEESAEKLNRILYYRDLDFPLKKISDLLDKKAETVRSDLLERRRLLSEQKAHIERLIFSIDKELSEPSKIECWFDKVLNDYNYSGFVYSFDKKECLYAWGKHQTPDKQSAFTLRSRFNAAEITMQFTAFVILLLKDKGLLSVEDYIGRYFPDCIYGNEIQISHLLDMTSGISPKLLEEEYDKKMREMPESECKAYIHYSVYWELQQKKTNRELVEIVNYAPLKFSPGEKFDYHSLNYELLGAIAEEVSGLSIEKLYNELIFTPLEMNSTSCSGNADIIGYKQDGSVCAPPNACNGYQGIITTAEDIFKWYKAVRDRKLLSEEGFAEMLGEKAFGFTCGLYYNGKYSCEGSWGEVFSELVMDIDKDNFFLSIRNKAPVPNDRHRLMYYPVKACDDGYVKLEVWTMQPKSCVNVISVRLFDENAEMLYSDERKYIISVENNGGERHAADFSENYYYELDLHKLLGDRFDSKKTYIIEVKAECDRVEYAQLGMVFRHEGEWQSRYCNVFYQYWSQYNLFMEALNTVNF